MAVEQPLEVDGIRVRLAIPWPSYVPRARGIHAIGKFGARYIVKTSIEDFNLIRQAAAKCGVTETEFNRWAMVQVAKEVMCYERSSDPEADEA
jgi:hypothetical protein